MKKLAASLLLAAAVSVILASAAFAQQGGHKFTAQLTPLNGSGASGNATVTLNGNQATVNIQSQGLTPGQPHAQHIHIGGEFVCPTAAADTDGSGAISTVEGQPFYGPVEVSLTTSGDVSADSALAVDRMPAANSAGAVAYSRTFTLPAGITAADIEGGSIVQHGHDFNGNGKYDFSAGKSSLDPSLPFEATVPAACGELASMAGTASASASAMASASATASPTATATASPAAGGLPSTGGTSLAVPAALALLVSGGIALALVRRRASS